MWIAGFIYLLIVLQYPLAWGRLFDSVPYWHEFQLIPSGGIGLIALILLLPDLERVTDFCRSLRRSARWPLWALGLLLCCSLFYSYYGLEAMLLGPERLFLLLLAAVHYRAFRKTLPLFLLLLAAASCAVNLREFLQHRMLFGLTGNWNWSATLLLVGFPALGLLLRRRWAVAVGAGLGLAAALSGYPAFSRGALLAAAAAALILLLLRYPRYARRLLPLAALAVLVLAVIGHHRLPELLQQDNRPALWRASLALGADNLLAGVGPTAFESALPAYLPEDYFLSRYAASRHTHPHNELLYWWNSWGLAGLVLIAAVAAVWLRAARNFQRHPRPVTGYLLFASLTFLLHGMLDLTIAVWPGNLLLFLLLGTLWGEATHRPERQFPRSRIGLAGAAVLTFAALLGMPGPVAAGWHYRQALIHRSRNRIPEWREALLRSIDARATPTNLYAAARCALFDYHDPELALEFLSRIRPETGVVNLDHNQGLRARTLALLGQPAEALHYFELEQRNFPLSVVNAYFRYRLLQQLRDTERAEAAAAQLRAILDRRRLRPEVIPYLLRHTDQDDNGSDIPEPYRLPAAESR